MKQILAREKQLQEELYDSFHPSNKGGFWRFCQHVDEGFFTDDKVPLREYIDILQKVGNRELNRVIVQTPPRFGKSYPQSWFSAWFLGYNPSLIIMRNTGTDTLAVKLSKTVRSMVGEPEVGRPSVHYQKYKQVFPNSRLSKIDKSVNPWKLVSAKRDCSYMSGTPNSGTIMGSGCDGVAMLDDYIANSKDANETVFDNQWGWELNTCNSRIEGDTPYIITSTRWGDSDISGMHLAIEGEAKDGGVWTVFKYPALVDKLVLQSDGTKKIEEVSICEAIFTTDKLKAIKKAYVNSGREDEWETVYQQNPTAPKGMYFPKSKLNYYEDYEIAGRVPKMRGHYTDPADQGQDCLASFSFEQHGMKIYITDVIYTNKDLDTKLENEIIMRVIKTGARKWGIEGNNIGHRLIKFFRKELRSKNNRATLKEYSHSGNKMARINEFSGQIREFFYFKKNPTDPQYKLAMKHICGLRKTGGRNQKDDAPDACAGIAEMIGINYSGSGGSAMIS